MDNVIIALIFVVGALYFAIGMLVITMIPDMMKIIDNKSGKNTYTKAVINSNKVPKFVSYITTFILIVIWPLILIVTMIVFTFLIFKELADIVDNIIQPR